MVLYTAHIIIFKVTHNPPKAALVFTLRVPLAGAQLSCPWPGRRYLAIMYIW